MSNFSVQGGNNTGLNSEVRRIFPKDISAQSEDQNSDKDANNIEGSSGSLPKGMSINSSSNKSKKQVPIQKDKSIFTIHENDEENIVKSLKIKEIKKPSMKKDSSKSDVPEFLKQEEILDPDCTFMIIGKQEKMDIFLKTLNEKIDADTSSFKTKIKENESENGINYGINQILEDIFKGKKLETNEIKNKF